MSSAQAGMNGPKGNNFDDDYAKKGVAYNTIRSSGYFLQQRGDWLVTRKAIEHGLVSGAIYGGSIGAVIAVYKRQMRYIPKTALLIGVPYSAILGISTVYRMDV